MPLTALETFQSPTNPSHEIQYTHLNRGAPHTLLFCYGAGGQSIDLTLYQQFISGHPSLSLLCIDRWTQPSKNSDSKPPNTTISRTGLALLSELTSITLELLGSLNIRTFSVAAHSAGAYQMLDLAQRCIAAGPARVKNIFPICTHIPAPFTSSKTMSQMCTMPEFLFTTITKLDSSLADTPIERLFLRAVGSKKADRADRNLFVDTPQLRDLIAAYKPSPAQLANSTERRSLDYRLGYCRIPGITSEVLNALYIDLQLGPEVRLTWFTCEADVFFGPASVQRVVGKMKSGKDVEVVSVEGASHADIHFRTEVWEGMYRRILKD